MDSLITLLTDYGYIGMFISAFLAGSIFPLSSEVVMLALMAAGLDPWQLVVYGTIGNTLGSMFNYWIGTLGRMDWIEKYLHVKKKDLDRAQRFMAGRGALMGFFAFLPAIGENHRARTDARQRRADRCQRNHRQVGPLRPARPRRGDIRITCFTPWRKCHFGALRPIRAYITSPRK